MPRALGASRSIHSLVVIGCPVSGLLPKPHQYPSDLIDSLGIEPSMTRTKGPSSSPRSALKNQSMNDWEPPTGPDSKSISGQCTATVGSPGSAPSAISSMLGWVAAVRATESPSHDSPAFIQRMCTVVSRWSANVVTRSPSWSRASQQVVGCRPREADSDAGHR